MKMHLELSAMLVLFTILQCSAQDNKQALSHIPKTGSTPMAFIPTGYDTLGTAKGDLNKDGKEDLAMVLMDKRETTAEMGDSINDNYRLLVILFKTENGWQLAGKSGDVVMCKGCGGVYGDPFAGISITNSVLLIDHFGGSNWRWGYTDKFRYQDGDFYLIGRTRDAFTVFGGEACNDDIGSANRDYEDINFVTGQRERIKTTEDCKVLLNKKDKIAKKPLVRLSKYKYNN